MLYSNSLKRDCRQKKSDLYPFFTGFKLLEKVWTFVEFLYALHFVCV